MVVDCEPARLGRVYLPHLSIYSSKADLPSLDGPSKELHWANVGIWLGWQEDNSVFLQTVALLTRQGNTTKAGGFFLAK